MTSGSNPPARGGGRGEFIEHPGLSLGTLLQVQFEGLGSSRSHLVGLDPGNFLIVQTPPIANIAAKLYQKNHGIVRYLFAGRVYAFRTTLLSLIKEPFRLAIIAYPMSIENMNLRKHERIASLIDAEVSILGQTHEGIISDISSGGCSFEFSKSGLKAFPELKVGERLAISMVLTEASVVFTAEVRGIRTDQENMTAGLQFIASEFRETDDLSRRELEKYIRTQQSSL
jgi:c-di-GMP-binding flagellar brake protein YcgR